MSDLYFQYDTQTGEFIRSFEGRKPITYKKVINGEVDTLRSANDIYKHSDDKLFSEFGVKKVTVIKPILADSEKLNAPVDDHDAVTRTYTAVAISAEKIANDLANAKASAKEAIDVQAGEVRAYFAAYPLIDEEYSRAYQLAKDWLVDITQDPNLIAPVAVSSWSTVSGMTDAEAAQNIVDTGDQYNQVLDGVRAYRLAGKAAIDAVTLESDIQGIKETYITLLRHIVPEWLAEDEANENP